ncbi:MAG: glycoside hydrolase family 3 N-terminal domain-containing protein [Ardenticatenaceae bacterium]
MTRLRHYFLFILISLLLGSWPAEAQTDTDVDSAEEILAAMSPAERVGQLFIVSFVGEESGPSSSIAQMIREDKVGGVVLLSANQNFFNKGAAPMKVRQLSEALQEQALDSSRLPLLIAIDHEGDGWPYTRLTESMTPLPNPMAIGATWNVERAYDVGEVTGKELSAAGINLLLGPSVDVLNTPRLSRRGDLGTRVFGGDPYWVGQMGRGYIRGVHEGSAGRMGTVAKHFPGHGNSDRLPDYEVATIDKSLQELRRIELPPFFAVTRFDEPNDPSVTDALMSSHIRYRGFQGDIRQFTAPISFDPQGLRTILEQEEFDQWRSEGLIVSDSLGVLAVKKYYDATGKTFLHRQIARDALMAGNDLLILAQFALEDLYEAQFRNMRDTLFYFRQQYSTDRVFAKRIDEAALRVIRLKLKLYPEFEQEDATWPALPKPDFGKYELVTEAVAEEALSLIYPRTVEELNDRLPRAPRRGEPIIVFTDARRVRDCFDCPIYPLLPVEALEEAILRRYGPQGTNQFPETQIISFSFDDLKLFLGVPDALEARTDQDAARKRAGQIQTLVERATWIVIATQDINLSPTSGTQMPRFPESDAAQWLLDAAAGSLFDKRVVVFAFNVPYQLDTTEISKLSALFGLYSRQDAFVDVAARVLFKDIVPQGAPPVTVDSVNYYLPTELEPEPKQTITLQRLSDNLIVPTDIEVETSLLLDRNGHAVPDGTAVEIIGSWRDNRDSFAPTASALTKDGIARTTISVTKAGPLELRVQAMQAESQRPLVLPLVEPSPTPSPTSEPTYTPLPSATIVPNLTPNPNITVTTNPSEPLPTVLTAPASPTPPPSDLLTWLDFLFCTVGTLIAVAGTWSLSRHDSLIEQMRMALLALIGGMGSYLFWGAIGAQGGLLWGVAISLMGSLIAFGVAYTMRE